MEYFRKLNRIAGWAAFVVAAAVYLLTIEPTASLWDCAEFTATSYKLEVGHPPGAPLFMMIARIFTLFAPSPAYVGAMVNAMSALCGAFTVLFLCWSITHLGRRIYQRGEAEMSRTQAWTVVGAGIIGSIAYCFTDTQWFSAVEAEVYSMSSMFTALVFWCILRWEEAADRPHSLRWLILIAYLMGLSVGVHLLNLLCVPAIVFVYYFRTTQKVTKWGVVKALAVAGAILLLMNNIVLQYSAKIGAAFDKMFVNGFGMAANSGLVFWVILLFALCGLGIWLTHKRGKVVVNTIMICLTFAFLGCGSYASMVIRAAADPPMNSNNPSNPYAFLNVLNREQYGGSQPILYGPYYSSPRDGQKFGTATWLGEDGKYHSRETIKGVTYPDRFRYLFPRMWREDKAEAYKAWGNVQGRTDTWDGQRVVVPTAGENLGFFFSYQWNYMYWRYFMWNFVGRQNDQQGDGGLLNGNWLSGVKFIDAAYLGPQNDLPEAVKNDKSRNTYFFLPFILGLIGLIYQMGRDKRNFAVVTLLFVMMGIALVIYFNTAPGEPRERDYVYAGSFYAFSIWIGLGVMAVRDWLDKRRAGKVAATAGALALCASVPLLLGWQNWDDHDRSHRYIMRDLGWNHLNSALPNAIVINYGDNDTFPLWYEQEVENVRPDVRIMNTSYLGADWYALQMTHKYNDSEPVPFSLPAAKYTGGVNDYVFIQEIIEEAVPLRELIDYVASDNRSTQLQTADGEWVDYIPTRSFYLPVNKENAVASGIVRAEDASLIVDSIPLRVEGNGIFKDKLMMLDLLATFDWKRPLHFTSAQMLSDLGLLDYTQYDGYGYRLVPIETPAKARIGRVDTEYLWKNLMETFRFGNVKDPRVHVDYFTENYLDANSSRSGFARLADGLMAKGDTVRAVAALDRAMEELPQGRLRNEYTQTIPLIQSYYKAGETEKANAMIENYSLELREYILYFLRFKGVKAQRVMPALKDKLDTLQALYYYARVYKQDHLLAPMDEIFDLFEDSE